MSLETSRRLDTADRRVAVAGPGSSCRASRYYLNDGVLACQSASNAGRCDYAHIQFFVLAPVPSGLFHAGHVPGDRPYKRAGYVASQDLTTNATGYAPPDRGSDLGDP